MAMTDGQSDYIWSHRGHTFSRIDRERLKKIKNENYQKHGISRGLAIRLEKIENH